MDFLCVGEMLADIIVHPVKDILFESECSIVDEIAIYGGGDAFNNAVNLSRLGNEVSYIGRVGKDVIGEYLVRKGQEEGIGMDDVAYSDTALHTKMTILLSESGKRSFLYYPGTSAEFCYEDVDLSLLNDCKVLQIGGTFHLPKFDGEGAAKLLKAAQEKGVITSMDVTKDFSGRWNEIIEPCYPYLDYFLPSIEQAELIAGTSNVKEVAQFFIDRGVKQVVVKVGKDGTYCKTTEKSFWCNSYEVPVAETTGAGDAFVAGFLTGVIKGFIIEDCVELGTATAAFAVQAIGATAGMRDYETIQKFIDSAERLVRQYD